jgi:hypothetical protein
MASKASAQVVGCKNCTNAPFGGFPVNVATAQTGSQGRRSPLMALVSGNGPWSLRREHFASCSRPDGPVASPTESKVITRDPSARARRRGAVKDRLARPTAREARKEAV